MTLYPEVCARIVNVNADSPAEAYQKACELAEPVLNSLLSSKGLLAGPILWTEYADEINGALVDVSEDEQFLRSVFLNRFGNQELTEQKCNCSHPELTIAASNLSIVMRSLGDDWLVRKLQSALDEIRDVAAVIRSRDNEDDRDQRQSSSK